jgi:hypothetical protein
VDVHVPKAGDEVFARASAECACFWNLNNSARTDLRNLLARDEHGHIGRYISTLDVGHRNTREGDLVCLASRETARTAAMTARIKAAHGFLIVPQTERKLDQIHHTFDLQTTHSEQRTAVLVDNEALSVSAQRLTGETECMVRRFVASEKPG